MATTIVWYRRDLRLHDHAPLIEAARRGRVVPLFILDPDESIGGASRWWLHRCLAALDQSLRRRGGRVVLRRGDPRKVLPELMKQCGADAVYWQRRYEPAVLQRDKRIQSMLGDAVKSFPGGLLREPWEVTTRQGGPFKVFTPFWRAHQALPRIGRPADAPRKIDWPTHWPGGESLGALGLLPGIHWYGGLEETWTPGETAARRRLAAFGQHRVEAYAPTRDFPAIDGTSMLSPRLHMGELSPRQILHAVGDRRADDFVRQLGWREFAYHVLHHFPHTPERCLHEKYEAFPWRGDRRALQAWQRGRTGYPLVDAGMRQLWRTGWMHNRARMVVASFLVKDLLIDWRLGAAWFLDTLVDADPAINTLNWQWAAGCGADAAPFFRVFNPTTQAKKFDPDGQYIRRWVEERRDAPATAIHQPDASPIVAHDEARDRALAALQTISSVR